MRRLSFLAAVVVALGLLADVGVAAAQRYDARAMAAAGRTGATRPVGTSASGGAGRTTSNALGRAPITRARADATSARSSATSRPAGAPRGAIVGYRLTTAPRVRGTTTSRGATADAAFWSRVRSAVTQVRAKLTDELRNTPWRGSSNRMAGHCYVASEALYHMLGGREAGWVPKVMRHEGSTHWFLEHRPSGRIVDPTADQFRTRPRYEDARGAGFLTLDPSARTRTVLERVER